MASQEAVCLGQSWAGIRSDVWAWKFSLRRHEPWSEEGPEQEAGRPDS